MLGNLPHNADSLNEKQPNSILIRPRSKTAKNQIQAIKVTLGEELGFVWRGGQLNQRTKKFQFPDIAFHSIPIEKKSDLIRAFNDIGLPLDDIDLEERFFPIKPKPKKHIRQATKIQTDGLSFEEAAKELKSKFDRENQDSLKLLEEEIIDRSTHEERITEIRSRYGKEVRSLNELANRNYRAADTVFESGEEIEIANSDGIPTDFIIRDGFLFFRKPLKEGSEDSVDIKISSAIRVKALVRDDRQENHGRLLEFHDFSDGHLHNWVMPMELLAGSGEALRRELLRSGLIIEAGDGKRNFFSRYIQECRPSARARCVTRVGWYRNCFVLPVLPAGEVIGNPGKETILFQSRNHFSTGSCVAGTLEGWKSRIGFLCSKNSRLIFCVSASFVPPLLEPLGMQGDGGIHLTGNSSLGKTSGLIVAASAWGDCDYMKAWRVTDNALESLCAAYNNCPLILDELSQFDSEKAAQAAYMIANGRGKSRSNADATLRQNFSWNTFLLSSGEVTLPMHIFEGGGKSKAGQEVRMIDIPADTKKFGFFEELHGRDSGAALSDELKRAVLAEYGAPSRHFIRSFIEKRDFLISVIHQEIKDYIQNTLPKKSCGQVHRVAKKFALIAIAGELATQFGITGWQEGEAKWAAGVCFKAWLDSREGVGDQEEQKIIFQVRKFFALHGSSRFAAWGDDGDKITNRCGYKRVQGEDLEFIVFPEILKSEIANGFDFSSFLKTCVHNKLIILSAKGEGTQPLRLPGSKKIKRFYVFSEAVLGEDEACQS